MTPQEIAFEEEVRTRVRRAIDEGFEAYQDILLRADGADPRLVRRLCNEILVAQTKSPAPAEDRDVSSIRSRLLEHLPAPDPALAQWWYTPETQELIIRRVLSQGIDNSSFHVLCIGAPTLAPLLDKAGCSVTVIELDTDVIASLKLACPKVSIKESDLLNEDLQCPPVECVIVDPPWYLNEMLTFLGQGLRCLSSGGLMYVSLPPLLTRPGIQNDRQQILKFLQDNGAELLFLDRNTIRYTVPRFEESAFANIDGFCGRPWRVADLLVCKKTGEYKGPEKKQTEPKLNNVAVERFSRKPCEFRVFMDGTQVVAPARTIIVPLKAFSENVSRRAGDGTKPNVWTSEKVGASVENVDEARRILSSWKEGKSLEETKQALVSGGLLAGTAQEVVAKYDQVLGLWAKYQPGIGRRLPEQIMAAKKLATSNWAATDSEREHGGSRDGFRPEFPRDRDRILWCGSFRKLAGKTQLFPVEEGDQLRQRLAHSVEVMQLATTIAESFGLDRDLVEAGALAHDIGHTPFGHAGEHAIDRLLTEMSPSDMSPGFNHYEHGVDVVRYLEGPYQFLTGSGHMGLNLTPEVCECIFKHTYCQGGSPISHDEIRKRSKHQRFLENGYCHLEGQAVRIADKVSYLVSDIEDGIRLNSIDERTIMSCRLFHRPPIDLSQPIGEPLLKRFLIQRRFILRVLMEDIISETGRRLARTTSRSSVRNGGGYLIDHSVWLAADVGEIWNKLQAERLHKDPRVIRANMMAGKIVSELMLLIAVFPELIPTDFRAEHERLWKTPYLDFYRSAYGSEIGVPDKLLEFLPLDRYIGLSQKRRNNAVVIRVENIIMAKDFVASLTDLQARKVYGEYVL